MYFCLHEIINQCIYYVQTLKQPHRTTFHSLLQRVYYFFIFYGDRRHSWILSDTPNTPYMFPLYVCVYIYIYIYICTYIYEHSVLILHYILTRKLRIKMIIEPNVSLRMNDLTRLLKIWFDQLMVLHLLSWLTLKLTEHLLSYYWR